MKGAVLLHLMLGRTLIDFRKIRAAFLSKSFLVSIFAAVFQKDTVSDGAFLQK